MQKPKNPRVLPVQDKINPTQRKSIGAAAYTGPRIRYENEAMPRTYNTIKDKGRYVPGMGDSAPNIRPGADDHQKYKRRGF